MIYRDNTKINMVGENAKVFLRDYLFAPYKRIQWVRRWGWKTDVIRFEIREGMAIRLHADILVPSSPDTNVIATVAKTDSSCHLGQDLNVSKFFVLSLLKPSLNACLVKHLSFLIHWLDGFGTPSQCVQFMKNDRNANLQPIAALHRLRHLKNLPFSSNTLACTTAYSYSHSDSYIKNLFRIPRKN